MRIFVTGATGYIGSAIVPQLLAAGHQVLGLARSDASATSLAAMGAEVQRGTLDDLDSLRRGAAASDGVIHTAFIHDFTDFLANIRTDQAAIEALGGALVGSGRPLVVTAGTLGLPPNGTEDDAPGAALPRKSEQTGLSFVAHGVRATVVRLPPSVHGDGDHAFVPALIQQARANGAAIYVGDGKNRWPAVHRLDAARLFIQALEHGAAGARFHAVADEGIEIRVLAELIGKKLGVPAVSKTPAEATALLGFIGHALAMDGPTSSTRTQATLGWRPTEVSLIADLEHGTYFGA